MFKNDKNKIYRNRFYSLNYLFACRELSVKEAIAMKQQGESTSTVERIKSLQQEIHELK